jgi:hypothetical protein
MAYRDLASKIHVRNTAESGRTRTDANGPIATLPHEFMSTMPPKADQRE